MLLAIDTATQIMSLALHDGRKLLAEQTWHTANNHTIELAPAIQAILKHCGVTFNDLNALAVSTGPGSYSGLRVGVSLAKGLAAAQQLPLVGVSTLDTLAAGQPYYQGCLLVVLQAGRGRIIVARYQWRKGRWGSRGEPQLMEWGTLFSSIDGTAYLTGEISDEGYTALEKAQAENVPITLVPSAYRLRRAGFLAEEAITRLSSGKAGFEAAKLVPIYIKTQDSPQP
ncbi:MAG TPA: tRNA (adenosine(37)-N6)-threonylcarbamoyltransferase complex dimerization subunit type 1 TsaB [Phototrophicaceae bacterium]|nr:tRNA (adenosine(37)-N6)-threonylcarbamoyltransferase complex dimerization subunit type 1 TsaB [Phototrophicaceae bacterium]